MGEIGVPGFILLALLALLVYAIFSFFKRPRRTIAGGLLMAFLAVSSFAGMFNVDLVAAAFIAPVGFLSAFISYKMFTFKDQVDR